MEKRVILQIPSELDNKILDVCSKIMISKSSVIKLAVNEYCEKILNK